MPTKMPDDFVCKSGRRSGPNTVHYDLLAADLGGWYSFDRKEVGVGGEDLFKTNLHNGARSRGWKAHTWVDPDNPGGVLACFYDPDEETP